MNNPIHALILELEHEAKSTRRLLERVPDDKLTWKPHPKSMSLGQLAIHVASLPANISKMSLLDGFDSKQARAEPPQPDSTAEILKVFEEGLVEAKKNLSSISPESATAHWTFTAGEKELFTIPRIGVVRTILLNHWYHHRGQLTVFLRLLDVPLPIVFGRSADENPLSSI